MSDLFNSNILEKALDAASLRQQVIANNISNVNTPGFRPQAVTFEEQLKQELAGENNMEFEVVCEQTEPEHFALNSDFKPGVAQVVQDNAQEVDVNKQMASLAKNQILYNALVGKITKDIGNIRFVIDSIR